jgi:hypothetical protein
MAIWLYACLNIQVLKLSLGFFKDFLLKRTMIMFFESVIGLVLWAIFIGYVCFRVLLLKLLLIFLGHILLFMR